MKGVRIDDTDYGKRTKVLVEVKVAVAGKVISLNKSWLLADSVKETVKRITLTAPIQELIDELSCHKMKVADLPEVQELIKGGIMNINSLKRNRTFIDQRLGNIESDTRTDPIDEVMKRKIAFSINLTQCPKCLGTEQTRKFKYCDIYKDTVCSACYWDARGKIKRIHMEGI